jgi:hypothetical protein
VCVLIAHSSRTDMQAYVPAKVKGLVPLAALHAETSLLLYDGAVMRWFGKRGSSNGELLDMITIVRQ